jgi:hypothetical protein
MFETERKLVAQLEDALGQSNSPWPELRFGREFEYLRGRADLVALSVEGTLLAFEAKLERWRQALAQAYRNLCFAHQSYVVLPRATAERAARYDAEFVRRGVGLCHVDRNRIVVIIEAPQRKPLQPWLSNRAETHVTGERLERPSA